MQDDSTTQILLAIVSSAFTTGVGYATLRTKISNHDTQIKENKEKIEKIDTVLMGTRETYVSSQALENAISHVYSQLNAMQKDIKDILKTVKS
jgi:peptidoglycan hydrolase CwlO-like protein